ncbi:MAG: hypothetical protein EBZ93_09640 [Actinobacteria bacterium]|nr:hypothetical protein [Actinomycetota bacterium]
MRTQFSGSIMMDKQAKAILHLIQCNLHTSKRILLMLKQMLQQIKFIFVLQINRMVFQLQNLAIIKCSCKTRQLFKLMLEQFRM